MADKLVETDVEKSMSARGARTLARATRATPVPVRRKGLGGLLARFARTRPTARVVSKSNTSALATLDSAIEKARPLLARGKDGTRRGTIGGVKVSLGRSGKSNGGARLFRAGSKMTYLDKPYADGGNSGRNQQRRNIKSYLASLKSGK